MLKNYTSTIDSAGKEIAIVSTVIFNGTGMESTAIMDLTTDTGSRIARILELDVSNKETVCLDTKIFISEGQKIIFSGADFVISGSEENVL